MPQACRDWERPYPDRPSAMSSKWRGVVDMTGMDILAVARSGTDTIGATTTIPTPTTATILVSTVLDIIITMGSDVTITTMAIIKQPCSTQKTGRAWALPVFPPHEGTAQSSAQPLREMNKLRQPTINPSQLDCIDGRDGNEKIARL